MCDQDHFENDRRDYEARGLVTRKQFGVMLGAGIAMMPPRVANCKAEVTESEVTIKTPDGKTQTATSYIRRAAQRQACWCGRISWGCGRRFARWAKGSSRIGIFGAGSESVLYRTKKAPTADNGGATPIQQVLPLAQTLSETTHIVTDAKAFIGWLDQQKSVAKNRKMGTQGYCMGGPMAFRTAAAVPDRVGAVGSFHGGGLVTDMPNSPHLEAAKSKAQFLIAIATNDDMRAPNDKVALKDTFAKANLPAEIEVYTGSAHGWCPPDSGVYTEAQAEKAWARLLVLYGKALA